MIREADERKRREALMKAARAEEEKMRAQGLLIDGE
jgi:hypothetical protein